MTTTVAVSVLGWMFLLLAWSAVPGMCRFHRPYNKSALAKGGDRRHLLQFRRLTNAATGGNPSASSMIDYGCWCGPGGHGKVVDDLDLCCKVHDTCYGRIDSWPGSTCTISPYTSQYRTKTVDGVEKCAEVNEYNDGDTEVECKYDLCRCDWDAAQCIGRLKQTYTNSHYDYSDNHVCENTGDAYTKNTADVAILIQGSHSITTQTTEKMKSIAEELVTLLDASSIDYKFSFGVYATEIQTSPFSDATSTSAIIQSYPTEEIGDDTYTETALQEIESKFNGGDDGVRGGDTPKILVLMTDGVSEEAPDTAAEVYSIAKKAKQIKDNSDIKIVGVVVPTTQRTPRIDELQSVVSEKIDAIDATASSASANDVAQQLAFRVKRWVKPVLYNIVVKTAESWNPLSVEGTDDNVQIKIMGSSGETGPHLLTKPSKTQGDIFEEGQVDDFRFSDGDVGTIDQVAVKRTKSGLGIHDDDWKLEKVTITKNDQTIEFPFNKWILKDRWYYEESTTQADNGAGTTKKHGGKEKQKDKGDRKPQTHHYHGNNIGGTTQENSHAVTTKKHGGKQKQKDNGGRKLTRKPQTHRYHGNNIGVRRKKIFSAVTTKKHEGQQ